MALKVIGAGMPRTGTSSLKLALEQLGLGPCYHMVEMIAAPERAPLWVAAAEGRPDWEAIFAGYQATTDVPGCMFWKELAAFYPDAKVILTVRDPAGWVASMRETVQAGPHQAMMMASPIGAVMRHFPQIGSFGDDPTSGTALFESHVASVKAAIAPERLLVFSGGDGWEPLCAFLGVPVPDTPYPRENDRGEARARLGLEEGGEGISFEDLSASARGFLASSPYRNLQSADT